MFPAAGEVQVNSTSLSITEGADEVFCVTLVGTTGSPTELGFQFRVSIQKNDVTTGLAQILGKSQYTPLLKP